MFLLDTGGNCLAAAKRAGISHIVRHSEAPPEPADAIRMARLSREIDAAVENSGLPHTSIRPSMFMQVVMVAIPTIASDSAIYMPLKDGKIGMVDIRDVAEVSANVLTTDGHEGQTYVLTGPATVSMNEVAGALSTALGKQVDYVNVPIAAARESLIGMGLSDWMADNVADVVLGLSLASTGSLGPLLSRSTESRPAHYHGESWEHEWNGRSRGASSLYEVCNEKYRR